MEPLNLGRCENHVDEMDCGGLIRKGPRCWNKAEFVAEYYQTVFEKRPALMKLCTGCLANVKKNIRAERRTGVPGASGRGRFRVGHSIIWTRKLVVTPVDKVTVEQVRGLYRSYRRIPRATLATLGIDP